MDSSMDTNLMLMGTSEIQIHITYLLDTSGSMRGEKINCLNKAMAEAIDVAEKTAAQREVQLCMRVIEFNNEARWICGTNEMNGLQHIDWKPLKASGNTATADAIRLVKGLMHRKYLGTQGFKPIVILITDGESDDPADTAAAVDELKASWRRPGRHEDRIIRIAVGVSGANPKELKTFASIGDIIENDDIRREQVPLVFEAKNISLLGDLMKRLTVSSTVTSLNAGTGAQDDQRTTIDMTDDEWI